VTHRLALLLAWLAFVVYGSLVPLAFRPLAWDEAWARFQAMPFLQLGVESRADWIANGVLYVPLGVLAALALAPRVGRWSAVALGWIACVAVAVAVEFAQLYFPPRTVSRNDLLAQAIGAGLGVFVAPWVESWASRLVAAARRQRARWALGLLQAYALAYVLLAFFPYDLLLGAAEWRARLEGGNLAWTVVTDRGLGLAGLRLAVEVALAVPLGVLLAWLGGWRGAGAALRGALAGLAAGLLLEAGQLALASGVSQGASVLARALGFALGAACATPLARWGLAGVRAGAARWGVLLLPVYVGLLLYASGWFRGAWHGPEQALAVLQTLRWVPFYYHYYTSEAVALYSLGMVALMYAPLAALAWARGWPPARTVAALAALALVVEAGKLFVAGQRPDPTNLLIVAASAWLAWMALQALAQPVAGSGDEQAAAAGDAAVASAAPGAPGRMRPVSRLTPWTASALAATLLLVIAAHAVLMPAAGGLLAAVLAGVALLCWWRPAWAPAAVLAAMPLLDLAPWTGPRWLNEFDLVLATALGLAALRLGLQPVAGGGVARSAAAPWLFGPWAAALLAGAGVTLWTTAHWSWPGHTAWHSGWAALALLKAALWAWACMGLCRRLDRAALDWVPAVAVGMQIGLAGVVAWVLWERQVFVGLTDFTADYRVTGPFSAMHRGGAFIECYLATACAFAMHGLWHARRPALRLMYLLLLAAAAYAVMVTFSRNGYAALAVVLVLSCAALMVAHWRQTRLRRTHGAPAADGAPAAAPSAGSAQGRAATRPALLWAWSLAGLLGAAAAALPVLAPGGYARDRLAASLDDLGVRAALWRDAVAMRTPALGHTLLGEGLGRFPELHFWRSVEPPRAASFQRLTEPQRAFLRLGPGATLYVEQVLGLPAGGPLQLQAEVRGRAPGPALHVALCEKSTLTSRRCAIGALAAAPDAAAERWHAVRLTLPVDTLDARGPPLGPQIKFSLLTPSGPGTLDVTRLRLTAPDGRELLANGDFARGMQRWAWATDVDPPWHVHSLPVHVWLEQGWLGAAAWALLLLGALVAAAAAVWQGRSRVPVALAALAGFMTSALLNTLVDEPRFLWLLLLYAAWALQRHPDRQYNAPDRPLS
jgi:VanZ family protein